MLASNPFLGHRSRDSRWRHGPEEPDVDGTSLTHHRDVVLEREGERWRETERILRDSAARENISTV